MTKEQLKKVQTKIDDLKKYINIYCEKGNDTSDILKSLIIMNNKCNYYLSNFDALNSHKKEGLGEDEK